MSLRNYFQKLIMYPTSAALNVSPFRVESNLQLVTLRNRARRLLVESGGRYASDHFYISDFMLTMKDVLFYKGHFYFLDLSFLSYVNGNAVFNLPFDQMPCYLCGNFNTEQTFGSKICEYCFFSDALRRKVKSIYGDNFVCHPGDDGFDYNLCSVVEQAVHAFWWKAYGLTAEDTEWRSFQCVAHRLSLYEEVRLDGINFVRLPFAKISLYKSQYESVLSLLKSRREVVLA